MNHFNFHEKEVLFSFLIFQSKRNMPMFGSAEEEGTNKDSNKETLLRKVLPEGELAAIFVRGGLQAGSPCGSQFRNHRFSAKSIKILLKRCWPDLFNIEVKARLND